MVVRLEILVISLEQIFELARDVITDRADGDRLNLKEAGLDTSESSQIINLFHSALGNVNHFPADFFSFFLGIGVF